MSIRDTMTIRSDLLVADALIDYGVKGDNERLARTIDVLDELGYGTSAKALAAVLDARQEYEAFHSVKA